MMKPLLLAVWLWLCICPLKAQQGCPDPLASNYNPAATSNNGICTYPVTAFALPNGIPLDSQVNESSGLLYVNGELWTFNDSGNAASLYKIDQNTGNVLRTVLISNASNVDWEDITADDQYIYIGDFGNNVNGNRQDLKIYKIKIADLYADPVMSVTAEIINFSYPDQTDFTATGTNNTEFDCEAFIIKNNQLHLFSKDWAANGGYQTKHYTLSTTPGSYIAVLKETFTVNGAITGADISKNNINEIVLVGYDLTNANIFMWLLFDYQNELFFSGNKRKIELGSGFVKGQIEGVTYTGDGIGYFSSERVNLSSIPARLYPFTSVNWVPLPVELLNFTATYNTPDIHLSWQTASERESGFFIIERSADGITFEEIHRQRAAGMSKSPVGYSFTDEYASPGTHHYRLKMIDKDGRFTYSSVQTVEVAETYIFNTSPVPVKQGEVLHIRYKGDYDLVEMSVRDMSGRTWSKVNYTSPTTHQIHLETTYLKPGVYILQIRDYQKVLIKKILIL